MNVRTIRIAAATVALATGLATSPAWAAGRIARRAENQQDRIGHGIASGALTPGEAARLERREAGLAREVRGMRQEGGGKLSPGERALVNRQQNRLSGSIYRLKHNGARQPR